MKLRDYQLDAVSAFFEYWARGPVDPSRPWGNPIVAMPTGTGKTPVIGEFIRQAVALCPGVRILVLTHVKELIDQGFSTLLRIMPTAPAGVYSAGLRRKDVGRQITFAGVGSIANAIHLFTPDIILIDECHTVSPKDSTTYRKIIASCLARNPLLKVGGLSATPYRLGQGMLVEPGGIFTDIALDMTTRDGFNWFISEGYLAPLVPKRMQTEIDISGVRISSTGDFNLAELQSAVDKDSITRAAVAETLELGADRNHWLVFAAGIEHAEHVAAVLVENGISAVCVHSKSGDETRDEAVAAFKAGKVRALVNNGVFTTGFDFPGIDLIVILRHTTSPGLWVQMLGRGTRPEWLPGFDLSTRDGRLACIAAKKPNCLVLDFAKNTQRLGPINDPIKPKSRKKSDKPGDCPAKVCAKCMTYNHASARVCSECGDAFPFKVKIETQAASDELIAGIAEPVAPVEEWFNVQTVTYSKHVPWNGKKRGYRNGVTASLRVSYNCEGLRSFVEFVCLEHTGHAQAMARQWWTLTANGLTIPQTIDEALKLADNLKQPERIRVWINRKNPQIQYREFSQAIA